MCKSDIEKSKILNNFIDKLLGDMENIDPSYSKIISENFWELMEEEKEIGNKTSGSNS